MKNTTYDKHKKKYVVRVTVEGKRETLGRFSTKKEAHTAYDKFRASQAIMEPYELEYEHQDVSIEWLKPFRAVKQLRERYKKQQLLDKQVDEKLRRL